MPVPDFDIFANRLRKMARHYDKWARRKGLSCYGLIFRYLKRQSL